MPGQVISVSTQVTLKPTPEQKAQLATLQKAVDAGLDKVLTDDQKKQLKQMRADFARGGRLGGLPGGLAPGSGGPGGGPPGSPGGNHHLFRAYKYGPNYPGLAGKVMKPGKTVEELQSHEPEEAKGSEKPKATASR